MVSLKKQKGFTLVELLIVIIIIGILATLVIVTFTGVQAKARDSQRQTDLGAVDSHLEAFYAEKGYYPSYADISKATWVAANLKGLDVQSLIDPRTTDAAPDDASLPNDIASSTATATSNEYGYVVTCTDNANDTTCTKFVLSAWLESNNQAYVKQSNV